MNKEPRNKSDTEIIKSPSKSPVPDDKESASVSNVSLDDNTCVVCFKNVEIYSTGECDHPVCYECSTRMRVLCQQNECPICRQVLSKVIFTFEKLPYRELEAKNRSEYYSKKYKIGFYTNKIQEAFFDLLDHQCPKCDTPPYRTFNGLKNHVHKEHDLHYCDICTEHLKIFTFERRCYTQAELGLHRVKGDVDNKSHRGHPLCEYCNCRYLDRDELFRHLRRDHYFCHFCDADGYNDFYKDYDALAEHFRQDHYLCEEGKCATEQFTGAFRSEIDYKAHVANVHGKSLNKQQVKQARTLQLEITLGRRGRSGQTEQGIANVRSRPNDECEFSDEFLEFPTAQSQYNQRSLTIDAQNEQDFPLLNGASGTSVSMVRPSLISMRNRGTAGLARTKENFPALAGSGAIGGGPSSATAGAQQRQVDPISKVVRNASSSATAAETKESRTKENFPALAGGVTCGGGATARVQQRQVDPISSKVVKNIQSSATGTVARITNSISVPNNNSNNNPTGMIIHVSNRPVSSSNKTSKALDFPALPLGKLKKNSSATAATRGVNDHALPSTHSTRNVNISTKHHTQPDEYPSSFQLAGKSKKNCPGPIRQIDEDMLPLNSNIPMDNVAAKHRLLVDDYVSVANPSTFQKLQLVQKEEQEAKARKAVTDLSPPQLTTLDFPTLASNNGSNGSKTNLWVKNTNSDKKQREINNRKLKVAPAPVLPKQNKPPTGTSTTQNNTFTDGKKDKKNKDNKKQSTAQLVTQELASKPVNKIQKEKNNNNENKPENANVNKTKTHSENNPNLLVTRPPPGFSNANGNGANNVMKPPPGFQSNVTVNSVAKPPNNLTFTSSLGERYTIVATHTYTQPPESITRNQKLVSHFKNSLSSAEALDEFRLISQRFREGVYKAHAYYEHCQAALKDKFNEIFPELLALLPDISKQQALYLVHSQSLKNLSAEQRKKLPSLEVCSICKQVLLASDAQNHKKLHSLNANFPSLGSTAATKASSTGNHK